MSSVKSEQYYRIAILAAVLAAAALTGLDLRVPSFAQGPDTQLLSYSLINGRWLDEGRFRSRTMYVVDGRFAENGPRNAKVIDLRGWHIIPPFAEAHSHNIHRNVELDDTIRRYLSEGVFYVKILSNLPLLSAPIRHRFNHPDAPDVVFANGGLTATGGHPIRLRELLLANGAYPGFTKETLANHGYFVIDSEEDLEAKWPIVLSFRPDFIKTFLLYSEEFERRRTDTAFFGQKGLDPKLLPKIVDRAHHHGLTVSCHVETGTDFHNAIVSGVDEIAHLPGFSRPERIESSDAKLAADKRVVVVTTASLAERQKAKTDLHSSIRETQRVNLKLLHTNGVRLAIGSDAPNDTSRSEVMYLQQLGVFSNRDLIRMWSSITAQAIFPTRRIGRLALGYEASFLALDGNPFEDFSSVMRIQFRMKQGFSLVSLDRDPKQ